MLSIFGCLCALKDLSRILIAGCKLDKLGFDALNLIMLHSDTNRLIVRLAPQSIEIQRLRYQPAQRKRYIKIYGPDLQYRSGSIRQIGD